MKLVTVEDLREGDIIANDVLLEDYTVVLSKGTVIKAPYIDKLREIRKKLQNHRPHRRNRHPKHLRYLHRRNWHPRRPHRRSRWPKRRLHRRNQRLRQ